MCSRIVLLVCVLISARIDAIQWNGNWAFACDFWNHDLGNAPSNGENCGPLCERTPGCTHFTWTQWNGGTCFMKYGSVDKSKAYDTGNRGMVCGVNEKSSPVMYNVKTTRHDSGDGKGTACALPKANYAVWLPFALGDVPELGNYKFRPDLCGKIFTINCGRGDRDIIVTDSNYGGGMDLFSQATWPQVAGNIPGTILKCTVQYTRKNPLQGGDYQCFTKPGTGTNNPWYRNIGLLNTGGRIVTGAFLGNRQGAHRGDNPYYAFDVGRAIDINEQVRFTFDDGSSHTVRFADCPDVGDVQAWK